MILASRASALALAQTESVAADLRRMHPGLAVRVETIRTRGDAETAAPLWAIGGQGLFTRELEEAMLAGKADAAVHSLKDMPTALPQAFDLVVPLRADPRDALVTREGWTLETLPQGAAVGTSSLRRIALVVCARPDLGPRTLRGNVDTRLGKVASGELPAVLLASAGMIRLGRMPEGLKSVPLAAETFVPAPGQGALALEFRRDDAVTRRLLEPLRDGDSESTTSAERALMRILQAGCHVPLGAHAALSGARMTLHAFLAYPDGRKALRMAETGDAGKPEALAGILAKRLLDAGAQPILDFARAAIKEHL